MADQLFAEFALPVLAEHVGEADAGAYLTPRGGVKAGPFDVILEHVTGKRDETDRNSRLEHELIAKFPRQDGLPFWGTGSLIGLIVTAKGEDWSFDLIQTLSDSMAVVRLVRRATTEVRRPGFRQR